MKKNISKSPLISVYITNYNYGNYLKKSINSVLGQSLQNFELIIIDDNSNDNSKRVLKNYLSNSKIIVIFNKKKIGLNQNNNLALKIAKGRFFIRLDADDWMHPNCLEILASKLLNDKKVGLVFPDYYLVDENNEIYSQYERHDFNSVNLKDQPAHGACTMIRTRLLKNIGGYNKDFFCQDGYDLWIRFIQKYKVKNINLPLFYYRQHNRNLTKNVDTIQKTKSKILENFNSKKIKNSYFVGIISIIGDEKENKEINLKRIRNRTLIEWTIDAALKSKKLNKLVFTSPNHIINKLIKKKYKKKLSIVPKSQHISLHNTPLSDTQSFIIKKLKLQKKKYLNIVQLFVRTPFKNHEDIDTAINIFDIFKLDRLISVVKSNNQFFKHNGNSLVPIQKDSKFLKLEREELYKQIQAIEIINFKKIKKKLKDVRVGHSLLSNKASHEIHSQIDFDLAEVFSRK